MLSTGAKIPLLSLYLTSGASFRQIRNVIAAMLLPSCYYLLFDPSQHLGLSFVMSWNAHCMTNKLMLKDNSSIFKLRPIFQSFRHYNFPKHILFFTSSTEQGLLDLGYTSQNVGNKQIFAPKTLKILSQASSWEDIFLSQFDFFMILVFQFNLTFDFELVRFFFFHQKNTASIIFSNTMDITWQSVSLWHLVQLWRKVVF